MTLGPDLYLDPATGDLQFVDGDLVMKPDLAQAIGIALRFIRGEWFLNTETGVPYFERFFVKNPNLEHLRAILRETILSVPAVKRIEKLELALETTTRRLTVTFAVEGDAGLITGVEVLGP